MEVEAKFVVNDPAIFERYRVASDLAGFALGALREVSVEDEYLDTASGDVEAGRYVVRVRERSDQRLLTVKSSVSESSTFSIRQEYEFPIGESFQLQDWPPGEARRTLAPVVGEQTLEPWLRLSQARAERTLFEAGGEPVAMLSLDHVDVWHEGQVVDCFDVLEVELLPGGVIGVLEQVIAHLAQEGLTPTTVAKLNRARAAVARVT